MAKRARPKNGRVDRKTRRPDGQLLKAKAFVAPPAPPVAVRPRTGPPPPAPPPGPNPEGLRLFQAGMEALQRHRYSDAAEGFRTLLDRYPAERALLDRARVYLELCERELKRKPADPRTVEERLTAATAALNDSNDVEAERLARSVLADDARHDTAMYLLAAIEARRGATDAAMSYLSQTIAISPEAKAQARYDADFETLRTHPAFQELIEAPPASAGPRRARRGRTER